MGKIIFITGTDTGVGKTLLTALLLYHLRQSGEEALAVKPFCSGSRQDVELLQAIQEFELPAEIANPFFFPEPVAPLVSARTHGRRVELGKALEILRDVAAGCDRLLVEGSGGLLVPLGEGYTVADLVAKLRCNVVVVARNKLGTINHTLLTIRTLQSVTGNPIKVVLIDPKSRDVSARTNLEILRELLAPLPVFSLRFLGPNPLRLKAVTNNHGKVKKVLAQILR